MSLFTRGRILAALVPLAAFAASVAIAPTSQAATVRPATEWVNCSNATEGVSGNQYYVEVACSLVSATSWELAVECSNDLWYYSGYMTTFENVSVYCPAGTTPIDALIYYTT